MPRVAESLDRLGELWYDLCVFQDPKALPHMRRILDHKSCDGACKRISLAECMLMMRRMGLLDEAQALFDSHKSLVGASDSKQGNAEWVHSWQFPQWFDPTVRAKPVWDTEEFPAAVAMRDNYEAIRAEFEQILEDHEDEFLLDGVPVSTTGVLNSIHDQVILIW